MYTDIYLSVFFAINLRISSVSVNDTIGVVGFHAGSRLDFSSASSICLFSMSFMLRIQSDDFIKSRFYCNMNPKNLSYFIMIYLHTFISIMYIWLSRKCAINLIYRHLRHFIQYCFHNATVLRKNSSIMLKEHLSKKGLRNMT